MSMYKLDTCSLRATDNLQEDWTDKTKIEVLNEIDRLRDNLLEALQLLDTCGEGSVEEFGEISAVMGFCDDN